MRTGLWLVSVGILLGGCSLETTEPDWVADVDGRRITLEALRDPLGPTWEEGSAEDRETLLTHELDRLIGHQLVLNRAEELGVDVGDEEVEALLTRLSGEQTRSVNAGLRQDLRREMVMDRTAVVELAPRLQISESTLALHFAEKSEDYATAPRVQVRQIVVEDGVKARRLVGEIRGGADLEALAREHSLGPEARQGGLLPPFAEGELPEAFDVAFKLEPGKISDVIESPYGYHIFRVEHKIPAREPTLDDVRVQIRVELERERFIALREEWLRDLRRKAAIRINDPVLESLR